MSILNGSQRFPKLNLISSQLLSSNLDGFIEFELAQFFTRFFSWETLKTAQQIDTDDSSIQ